MKINKQGIFNLICIVVVGVVELILCLIIAFTQNEYPVIAIGMIAWAFVSILGIIVNYKDWKS